MNKDKRIKILKNTIRRLEDQGLKPSQILDVSISMFMNYAQFLLKSGVKDETEENFNIIKKDIIDCLDRASKILRDFEFIPPTTKQSDEELLALLKDADKIPNAEMVKKLSKTLELE